MGWESLVARQQLEVAILTQECPRLLGLVVVVNFRIFQIYEYIADSTFALLLQMPFILIDPIELLPVSLALFGSQLRLLLRR